MATTAKTYTDEHIEYWGKIYEENNIRQHGILFEMFLKFPEHFLSSIKAREFLPLLPEQRRVAAELSHREAMDMLEDEYEQQIEKETSAVKRDSGYVQPMHHCRHRRRAPAKHHPFTLRDNSHV